MLNKRNFLILFTVFSVQFLPAQEQDSEMDVLYNSSSYNIGGFGGPNLIFSTIDGSFTFFTGLKGGVILDHNLVFGIEGYQLTSNIPHKNDLGKNLNFVYGGFFGGYIFNWKSKIHFNSTFLIGFGGVGEKDGFSLKKGNNFRDTIFVLQPSLELEINLFRHFRVGFGVNYRFVPNINIDSYSGDEFSSLGGVLSLKFGDF